MQIELTIVVRHITAKSYDEARSVAYRHLLETMPHYLDGIDAYSYTMFTHKSRVARETDQTFTVTIP